MHAWEGSVLRHKLITLTTCKMWPAGAAEHSSQIPLPVGEAACSPEEEAH